MAQDGSGFDFMSPTVFQYIVKPDVTAIDPPPEDVPDMEVVQWIESVSKSHVLNLRSQM